MADTTPRQPGAPAQPTIGDSSVAPFIYFDLVGGYGVFNGAIQLEVIARTLIARQDGGVDLNFVPTARIRCSPAAAIALRDACNKALEMLQHTVPDTTTSAATPGRLN